MSSARKIQRRNKPKKKGQVITDEGLIEVGMLAGQIAEYVESLLNTDDVNTYAVALALETQVQLFCRRSGMPVTQLAREASEILDDPRLKLKE